MSFGDNLRAFRKSLGLSVAEMARLGGVSERFYYRLERRNYLTQFEIQLLRLVKNTEASLDALYAPKEVQLPEPKPAKRARGMVKECEYTAGPEGTHVFRATDSYGKNSQRFCSKRCAALARGDARSTRPPSRVAIIQE